MISPKKQSELENSMKSLGIKDEDLSESFIRGSGKGGQKKNKTSSAVLLIHTPTGIRVRCESERSQSDNRFIARRELCERLTALINNEKLTKDREAAKIRKQKATRSRKTKNKILKDKSHQSEKKSLRKEIKN